MVLSLRMFLRDLILGVHITYSFSSSYALLTISSLSLHRLYRFSFCSPVSLLFSMLFLDSSSSFVFCVLWSLCSNARRFSLLLYLLLSFFMVCSFHLPSSESLCRVYSVRESLLQSLDLAGRKLLSLSLPSHPDSLLID